MPFYRPAQSVIDDVETTPRPEGMSRKVHQAVMGREAQKIAPSLKPGPENMMACCTGDEIAIAERDAWAFRFSVTKLNPTKYKALIERTEGITWNA